MPIEEVKKEYKALQLDSHAEDLKVNPLTDKQTTTFPTDMARDSVNNGESKTQTPDSSKEDCLVSQDDHAHIETAPFVLDTSRFSTATKLIRVTTWCLRFVRRLRGQRFKTNTPTSEEFDETENMWLNTLRGNILKMFTVL